MKAEITSPYEYGQMVYAVMNNQITEGKIIGIKGCIEDFSYGNEEIKLRVSFEVGDVGFSEWIDKENLFADRETLIKKLTGK